MAKEKTEEAKIILEREYIVPLRSKWLRVQEFRRVPKAVKALKEFIAKHMKVEDRDLRKVKLDKWLNNEMWFRGIRKPASKIKVKAKKLDSGIVIVELSEIPQALKWKIDKEKKHKEQPVKKEEAKEEKKEETAEEKTEKEEKEKSTREAGLKEAKIEHKEAKHESQSKFKKQTTPKRMALQK